MFNPNVVYTTDDVSIYNLKYWNYWLEVKEKYPEIKVIAFTIANHHGVENVGMNEKFLRWFEENKGWVEIGVHGYDHDFPPEQEREDAEEFMKKSLDILRPFLPEKFLYRPPGFQTTARTEQLCRKLGFYGIAHQTRIKYFTEPVSFAVPFNTHCSNQYFQRIVDWKNFL